MTGASGDDIYAKLVNLEARDPEGHDNAANDLGKAEDILIRLPGRTSYTDGLGALPASVAPTEPPTPGLPPPPIGTLPQARAISDAVMAQGTADIKNSYGVNEWFQFFGQAITHDVVESATGVPPGSTEISGSGPPFDIDGLPFPFGRTPFKTGTGVNDDDDEPRQQINDETSFLDLSFVYGNSAERLALARDDVNGQESAKLLMGAGNLLPTIKEVGLDEGMTSLEVLAIMRPPGFGGLPDPSATPAPADTTFEERFYAGDNRVNQTPALIAQQTIWAREHNYQVDQLTETAVKNGWTQDQLFEAARAITEAEWQHVVYNEYLPKLIGKEALAAYSGYKADVDPRIINEWTTVAFRFGHDQSSNALVQLDEGGAVTLTTTLGAVFGLAAAARDVPGAGHNTKDIDSWIRGLTSRHTQEIDGLVVDGNRNLLFGGVGGQTTDLTAFDIQRGRDHGVSSYNILRENLRLDTYASFDEFAIANGYDPASERMVALKNVYGGDFSKMDSIIGVLLEKAVHDSQLGETGTLLNIMQFTALRDGDKFWYEHRFADNPELLAMIKKTTFADIIQRNSGVEHVYHDAFAAHNRLTDTDGDGKIAGTEIADLIIGTDNGEEARGAGGDDDIYLGAGDDKAWGGVGDDRLYGGDGNDKLYGEAGNDILAGGKGDDLINGGAGNDTVDYSSDPGRVVVDLAAKAAWSDAGNDKLISIENVKGTSGDDWISGTSAANILEGGDGDDVIHGLGGNDVIDGGAGDNALYGGNGADTITSYGGNDWVEGGKGNDTLTDINSSAGGWSALHGDDGNDLLIAVGQGTVGLWGGNGDDTFHLGTGTAYIYGGKGADTYRVDTEAKGPGERFAQVFDFKVGEDMVEGEFTVHHWGAHTGLLFETADGGTATLMLMDVYASDFQGSINTNGMTQDHLLQA